jgi:HAD superfamily hydrolase (TIGR01509 family)
LIEAVVFDLDGVMIDSEPLSWVALNRLLEPVGSSLSYAEYQALIGLDSVTTAKYVNALSPTELSVDYVLAELERLRIEIIREQAEPIDGLIALVAELANRGLPLAVASNSPSAYVRAALEAIGMSGEFKAAIGEDDVENGKPAPDLYLKAASILGAVPGACLVFEDSPAGMASAVAAGTRCVVIPSHDLADADFSPAHARYDSLLEVHEDLETLLS